MPYIVIKVQNAQYQNALASNLTIHICIPNYTFKYLKIKIMILIGHWKSIFFRRIFGQKRYPEYH